MTDHVFRAELWEHSPGDPGSWHFVSLPVELAEDIRLDAGATCEVSLEVAG
jgi:hypothetical protein